MARIIDGQEPGNKKCSVSRDYLELLYISKSTHHSMYSSTTQVYADHGSGGSVQQGSNSSYSPFPFDDSIV